jgi:hypothetical protein
MSEKQTIPVDAAIVSLLYACFVSKNSDTQNRVVDLVEAVKAEHQAAAPDQHFSHWVEREVARFHYSELLADLDNHDRSYLRGVACEAVAAMLDKLQPYKGGATYWLEFGGEDEDSDSD